MLIKDVTLCWIDPEAIESVRARLLALPAVQEHNPKLVMDRGADRGLECLPTREEYESNPGRYVPLFPVGELETLPYTDKRLPPGALNLRDWTELEVINRQGVFGLKYRTRPDEGEAHVMARIRTGTLSVDQVMIMSDSNPTTTSKEFWAKLFSVRAKTTVFSANGFHEARDAAAATLHQPWFAWTHRVLSPGILDTKGEVLVKDLFIPAPKE